MFVRWICLADVGGISNSLVHSFNKPADTINKRTSSEAQGVPCDFAPVSTSFFTVLVLCILFHGSFSVLSTFVDSLASCFLLKHDANDLWKYWFTRKISKHRARFKQ